MKRGHWIKEEISVYFRMALGRGVAGQEQAPHGWEVEQEPLPAGERNVLLPLDAIKVGV